MSEVIPQAHLSKRRSRPKTCHKLLLLSAVLLSLLVVSYLSPPIQRNPRAALYGGPLKQLVGNAYDESEPIRTFRTDQEDWLELIAGRLDSERSQQVLDNGRYMKNMMSLLKEEEGVEVIVYVNPELDGKKLTELHDDEYFIFSTESGSAPKPWMLVKHVKMAIASRKEAQEPVP